MFRLVLILVGLACASAREVQIEAFAPWEQPIVAPLHEVGEFVGSTNNSQFFDYVDRLCLESNRITDLIRSSAGDMSSSVAELQQLAYTTAKSLLSPDYHQLMESMVESAYFAPEIALQSSRTSSLSENSTCPVDIAQALSSYDSSNVRISCTVGDFSHDHVYTFSAASAIASAPSLVLKGILGNTEFCAAYQIVKEKVSLGNIRSFSIEPSTMHAPASSSKVDLAGFGVFLDIKNMEYKNVDETPSATSSAAEKSESAKHSIPSDLEIAGINLHTLRSSHQDEVSQDELLILKDRLLTIEKAQSVSDSSEQEMKVWKMKDLGLQAAQMVHSRYVKGDNPLMEWTTIAHNFPRVASQLSSLKVSSTLRNDVETWYASQAAHQLPSNSLYLNGMRVELSDQSFNFFDLQAKIQEELVLQHSLDGLILSAKAKEKLFDVAMRVGVEEDDGSSDSSNSVGQELEAIVKDIRRIDVSKGGKFAVMFLNNLEKDSMYKQMGWPKTLRTLLYPSWSLHTLARNLYTFIANIDIFSENGAGLLTQMNMLYQQQYPLRFGAVFACDKSLTHTDFCRLFAAIKEEHSQDKAFEFAFQIAASVAESLELSFDRDTLIGFAAAVVSGNSHDDNSMFGSLFGSSGSDKKKIVSKDGKGGGGAASLVSTLATDDKYMDFVTNSTTYLSQRNIPLNSYSINGIVSIDPTISQAFMQIISREQYILSSLVRHGKLSDKSKSIFADLMKIFGGIGRYHVMLDETQPKYLHSWALPENDWQEHFLTFSSLAVEKELAAQNVQHLVAAIPATPEGMTAILNALSYTVNTSSTFDLLWLPHHQESVARDSATSIDGSSVVAFRSQNLLSSLLTQAFKALAKDAQCNQACTSAYQQVLQLLIATDLDNSLDSTINVLTGLIPGFTFREENDHLGEHSKRVTTKLTGEKEAKPFISLNGRVLSPSPFGLQASDLELLFDLESKRIGKLIAKAGLVRDASKGRNAVGAVRLVGILSSFLGQYNAASGKRTDVANILRVGVLEPFHTDLSTLITPIGNASPDDDFSGTKMEIYCIVDPLSLAGQRGAAMVDFLVNHLGYRVTLLLTPRPEISEFPLQNFYRFVLPVGKSNIDEDSGVLSVATSPRAVFDQLPRQHTLTTRTDVPEPWNVQTAHAFQDTDNLRCSTASCGDEPGKEVTKVGYVLKSLLVAGQCLQTTVSDRDFNRFGLPPNGLQLMLYTPSLEIQADTLVMQNLGYYQLQVPRPGSYLLGLAPGRATELFTLRDTTRVVHLADGIEEEVLEVTVRSFRDEVRRLVVVKRPGMESKSLLEDQDGEDEEMLRRQQESLWSRMTRTLTTTTTGSAAKKLSVDDEDKTIHVFSLASGHLYERFLRIMMLSVSRRTSQPVKFWLFENYLSPSFKALAATMAEHYGFEIGYVTYKWPAWLRQQTQQQRIIWGYKVLFLDVLFPLNVKKIIYVDADQVIRADLKELWDLDLQGHAYAYTPFCTSRQETLGFQFWRQGYWKDHLQGRPYHISALYVVDLQRFRRRAVGDQLRAVYDNLSRDPNSLANLDQDLPNYAQHSVPIFSLPQEWLWCETWCSDDSKAKAKTIDLCNNPLHKEPKMDMAKRVISGPLFNESWVQLDEEIRTLATKYG